MPGDRVIERVANLLGEQVRSEDLLAQERSGHHSRELHAAWWRRVLLPHFPISAGGDQAYAVAERFRGSRPIASDWTTEDPRLADQPVPTSMLASSA